MLDDFWISYFAPCCLQRTQRAFLVLADEPRVTDDIRDKNGGESVFDPLCAKGRNRSTAVWSSVA